MPPSPKNPKGYWESMSLVAFNERLLRALGSDMRWPGQLGARWEGDQRLRAFRAEAPLAFRRTFPEEPWVWKDPRLCLTLSFWRSVLGVQPAIVLVNRNPLEIAESSLRAGRGEGKGYFLALWERYLRQSLPQLEGLPALVTSWDALLADPVAWCDRAGAFLVSAGLDAMRPSEEDVLEFVDPGLRHAESSREAFLGDSEVSTSQRDLFLLLESAEGFRMRFAPPDLPPETPGTETLLAERRQAARRQWANTRAHRQTVQATQQRLRTVYRLLRGSRRDR